MPHFDRYERTDKAALEAALLSLGLCPSCRRSLPPRAGDAGGMVACAVCGETWTVPQAGKEKR